MQSIWNKHTQLPRRKPLETDIQADVCVIGGGMAGILTAYQLQQLGLESVVLEASQVGSGQTKNTTAKITSQHSLIYADMFEKIGREAAQQYANANQKAIEDYHKLIDALAIDCDLENKPAFLYTQANPDILKREAEAARSLGIPAQFTLDVNLPFPVKGALRFDGQAQFSPLKFLKAVSKNLTVYEDTMAEKIDGGRVITRNGATVRAKSIVMATHYPFLNTPGYYFLRMHQERSYVIALEGARDVQGMYLGIDPNGLSLRNSGKYLLIGGGKHRTGENTQGGRYRRLEEQAQLYFSDASEAARWSAQDCITLDGIPYIGRFSPSTPNLFVATGFNKWGMTTSMAAASILAFQIAGIKNENSAVFDPHRFHPAASMENAKTDVAQSVKGLSKGYFGGAKAAANVLTPGHGGVVEYEGEKLGVYKDENGEVFAVSTKCPHLGCQLEWNPDELSWDCPCHGSRFTYRGELIDNPAMEGLDHA